MKILIAETDILTIKKTGLVLSADACNDDCGCDDCSWEECHCDGNR